MLSFFPRDVLDEIWDLIESVSEGFLHHSVLNTEREKGNYGSGKGVEVTRIKESVLQTVKIEVIIAGRPKAVLSLRFHLFLCAVVC